MSRLRKTVTITALVILGPILAACAQQNPPDSHPSSMGSSGMMGMHQDGSGGQMQDMNKMMAQMGQMMDRCDAMMKDHKMHSPGGGNDSH